MFHPSLMRGTTHYMTGPHARGHYWALTALVLGAIAIAFAGIFAKGAMNAGYMGALTVGFWRFAFAVPVFLAAMLIIPGRKKLLPRKGAMNPVWLLLPGVVFALDIGFWHVALSYTTVATSTLLANVQVFIVGLVGWLLLKERLKGTYLFGLLLAFGGICLLLTNHETSEYAPNPWLGDGLSMVVAVWYASYLILVKFLRRDFRAVEIMLVSSAVAAVCLFITAILTDEDKFLPFYDQSMPDEYTKAWYYLVLLALIPQCLGQGLIVWALSRLKASFTAVVLLLQPVAAAALGWIMFGEILGPWQIVACGVVLAGIVLARLGTLDTTPAHAEEHND